MMGKSDKEILSADELKEMKYHYKVSKKAWRKANRKAAWPLRILIILLLAAIAFAGYKMAMNFQNQNDTETILQVIPVTVTEASKRTLVTLYKGNGDVAASSSIDVYPDTPSGKVTRIDVELGDYVRKDQVLMLVDPSRPGQTYAPSPVKAPVSGTITNLSASVGSLVSAQMPVATVGDLSNLEVVTYIPEKYVSNVVLGQEARISLISWNDDYILGKISEISPVVDPSSRTMKVKISFKQGNSAIKAGMFVRISMVTQQFPDVLSLPSDAVIERFDKKFVYTIQDDRAKRVEITSDMNVEGYYRITSNINEGDQVILKGNNLLEDGTPVRIVEDME